MNSSSQGMYQLCANWFPKHQQARSAAMGVAASPAESLGCFAHIAGVAGRNLVSSVDIV